jgi:hypothetical protein
MNYVIIPSTREMLCNDNQIRSFPLFGTYRWCVKKYKTLGRAMSAAKKFRDTLQNDTYIMTVHYNGLNISDNFSINSRHIFLNGSMKSILCLIDEQERGIQNDFPVTFTKVV